MRTFRNGMNARRAGRGVRHEGVAVRRAAKHEPLIAAELARWSERAQRAVFYARGTCRAHGYALAVHGSLRRDIDVVAVPWTDDACDAITLAKKVCDALVRCNVATGFDARGEKGEKKPLGRRAWSILLKGEPFTYLDLSVAPRGRRRKAQP